MKRKILIILDVLVILVSIAVITMFLFFRNTLLFWEPLFYEDIETIDYLIDEKGIDPNNLATGYNLLTVYIAGAGVNAKVDFVEYLLKKGFDPNNCRREIGCPIYFSILWHRNDIAEMLIKYGADINIQMGKSKITPLRAALTSKDCEMAKLLYDNGGNLGEPPEEWVLERLEKCKANNWVSTEKFEIDYDKYKY